MVRFASERENFWYWRFEKSFVSLVWRSAGCLVTWCKMLLLALVSDIVVVTVNNNIKQARRATRFIQFMAKEENNLRRKEEEDNLVGRHFSAHWYFCSFLFITAAANKFFETGDCSSSSNRNWCYKSWKDT